MNKRTKCSCTIAVGVIPGAGGIIKIKNEHEVEDQAKNQY